MVAREAEKESVFYENQEAGGQEQEQEQEQEAAGALPQPAWAASAAGTMHLGAQSWDFGVNISSAPPPTPGYVCTSFDSLLPRLASPRLEPAAALASQMSCSRAQGCVLTQSKLPTACHVITGGARRASSPGCRTLRPRGDLRAVAAMGSSRAHRGLRCTRLATAGVGSTMRRSQARRSRARVNSATLRAASTARRSGRR